MSPAPPLLTCSPPARRSRISSAPLVYLHGWLGDAGDWTTVREALPGYAIDLPGHGASLHLPTSTYTLTGAADALVATLDAAQVETSVLVGYSMGGRVALTAALRHPGRFRALVLESASPGLRTEAGRTARRGVDDARAESVDRDFEGFLNDWYQMPLFASLARDPERLAATIQTRRKGDPAELARALRGLSVACQPSYWERLGELPPTLALAGAHDSKYIGVVEALAPYSSITTRIIPQAGHNIHLEQPAAFVEAVRGWLAARG